MVHGTSKRVSVAKQCLVQKQSQSMSGHANCNGDAALNPLYGFPFHHIGWQRHNQLTGSRVAYFHGERHKQRESGHEQHTISLFFHQKKFKSMSSTDHANHPRKLDTMMSRMTPVVSFSHRQSHNEFPKRSDTMYTSLKLKTGICENA